MNKRLQYIVKPVLAAALTLAILSPAFADPPPWAPAHGYRNRYPDQYEQPRLLPWHGRVYESPYIRDGRCDRDTLGAVLGGVVGGVAGSQIGKGTGRTAATIAGTVIGILVGRSIGRSMNASDQQCTGQALEYAPDQASVYWRNPDNGTDYSVTPIDTWRNQDGRYCREYSTRAVIGGRSEQVYGRACRQADGSWVPL